MTAFVSNTANVVLDINGYFITPTSGSELAFFPITPCRLADTRNVSPPALSDNALPNL